MEDSRPVFMRHGETLPFDCRRRRWRDSLLAADNCQHCYFHHLHWRLYNYLVACSPADSGIIAASTHRSGAPSMGDKSPKNTDKAKKQKSAKKAAAPPKK